MHIESQKREGALTTKLPQEYSSPLGHKDQMASGVHCDGITKESLLLMASEVTGHHHWQVDHSPRGLNSKIEKLKSLGLSLGEPYSLVDSKALENGEYAEVSLVAIVPIKLRDSILIPYVIEYQREDRFSELLAKKINSVVRESVNLDGSTVVTDKERDAAEAKAARLRWAGAALGTLSFLGIGAGIYSAVEPVAAVISNWKQERVARELSDLVRVRDFLEQDSSQAALTLAPITTRHYASLTLSLTPLFSEFDQGKSELTSEQKAELLVAMARHEIRSGRSLDGSKDPSKFFIEKLYEVIERAPSHVARSIAANGLYSLAHPNGDPVPESGIWASFSRYMNSTERAHSASLVKDLARIDGYLQSDSNAAVKTLAPITGSYYLALRDSFDPEADPVVLTSVKLSEKERVDILVRMMNVELSSNRGIPSVGNEKSFFRDILKALMQSCTDLYGRAAAAEALHGLGER